MGGLKTLNVAQFGSAEKENHPPKSKKATVSVAGLFDKQRRPRQNPADRTRDMHASSPSRVSKQSKSKRAEMHPIYRSFSQAANEYRNGVADSIGMQLEPVYNALVARVDQPEGNNHSSGTIGVPFQDKVDAMLAEAADMSKPLEEETMTVQNRRKNGSVDTKNIKLGDTLLVFQKLLKEKRAELETIFEDLKTVNADIAVVMGDIIDLENGEVKKAKDSLNAELAVLSQRTAAVKERTLSEVEATRQEDISNTADAHKKLKDFVKDMS